MRKILLLIGIVGFFSCKKDTKSSTSTTTPPPTNTATSNDVKLNFTNMVGSTILKLSKDTAYHGFVTPKYLNANNDTFYVTRLKYYMSGIRLKKSDGSYYNEVGGSTRYHLLDASDSVNTCTFNLPSVPLGNYVSLEFIIGVDSAANCSGAQTGSLDPIHGMFWSWASGYIFFKLEAYSPSAPVSPYHNLQFDIGGYLAPNDNIKTISLPLSGTNLTVVGDHISTIYLKTDILEALKTPTTINFATTTGAGSPSGGVTMANNYVDMISVAAVKN